MEKTGLCPRGGTLTSLLLLITQVRLLSAQSGQWSTTVPPFRPSNLSTTVPPFRPSYLVSLYKNVYAEPYMATCGTDPDRNIFDPTPFSVVPEDYIYQFDGAVDFTQVQCTSTCPRTYPRNHTVNYLTEPGEVIYLGGDNCSPGPGELVDTESSPMPSRRKREDSGYPCYYDLGTVGYAPKQTFMMEFYAQGNGVIVDLEELWLELEGSYLYLVTASSGRSPGVEVAQETWVHVAVQLQWNVYPQLTLFVNGEVQETGLFSNYGGEYVSGRLGLGNATDRYGCEFLQVPVCREALGRSSTIYSPFGLGLAENQAEAYQILTDALAQDLSQCEVGETNATAFLCGLLFPDCREGFPIYPCTDTCDALVRSSQSRCSDAFIGVLGTLGCSDLPQDCADAPDVATDPVFHGKVRDVKIYDDILTNREIVAVYNWGLPRLPLLSECLCPDEFPAATETEGFLSLYCDDNDAGDSNLRRRDSAKDYQQVADEGIRGIYLTNFLTDGLTDMLDTTSTYVPQYEVLSTLNMWVSTPGLETFSLKIDLEESILVAEVQVTGQTAPAAGGYTLAMWTGSVWRDLQSFSGFCRETDDACTAIPGSGLPGYFLDWVVPDFDGVTSSVSTNKLRLTVHGFPLDQLESAETSLQYHAITEFSVYGVPRCACYSPGTEPDTECDDQGICVCIDEVDVTLAGPQCGPYISAVVPGYGPVSGGTVVTLYGALLDTSTAGPRVWLQDVECLVTEMSRYNITCVTPPVDPADDDSWDAPRDITVLLDATKIIAPANFAYRPDPVILTVSPLRSILEGGLVQTVVGENLDSVYAPRMIIYFIFDLGSDNADYVVEHVPCTVVNSTQMECTAPPVPYRADLQHLYGEFAVGQGTVAQTDVAATIGFWLDGVTTYRVMGSPDAVPNYSQLVIYFNPEFFSFPERVRAFRPYSPHNDYQIEITGQRLAGCCDIGDYTVLVGQEECVITYLDSSTIYCDAPLEQPDFGINPFDNPPVRPSVGFINATVGYLEYEHSLWENTGFLAGIICGILAVIIIILIIVLLPRYLKKRRQRAEYRRASKLTDLLALQNKMPLLDLLPNEIRDKLEGYIIPYDSLKLGKELGKGNFGVVYKGSLHSEERGEIEVAVKTIKKSDTGLHDIDEFMREATITVGFEHPNVLAMIGVSINFRDAYVVLPFMEGGCLKDILLDTENALNVAQLIAVGLQAASGMSYLEEKSFMHGDLAVRNCMVGSDNVIKIADFGLSRNIYESGYYRPGSSKPLPIKWMAIECLDDNARFTSKSDVWSYGVLLWEIMTRGKTPYSNVDQRRQLQHLKLGGRLAKPNYCPEEVYTIMLNCWHTRPEDRPTFKAIQASLQHLLGPAENSAPPYVNQPFPPTPNRAIPVTDRTNRAVPDIPSRPSTDSDNTLRRTGERDRPNRYSTDPTVANQGGSGADYTRMSYLEVLDDRPYERLSMLPDYLQVVQSARSTTDYMEEPAPGPPPVPGPYADVNYNRSRTNDTPGSAVTKPGDASSPNTTKVDSAHSSAAFDGTGSDTERNSTTPSARQMNASVGDGGAPADDLGPPSAIQSDAYLYPSSVSQTEDYLAPSTTSDDYDIGKGQIVDDLLVSPEPPLDNPSDSPPSVSAPPPPLPGSPVQSPGTSGLSWNPEDTPAVDIPLDDYLIPASEGTGYDYIDPSYGGAGDDSATSPQSSSEYDYINPSYLIDDALPQTAPVMNGRSRTDPSKRDISDNARPKATPNTDGKLRLQIAPRPAVNKQGQEDASPTMKPRKVIISSAPEPAAELETSVL